jgi:hypothetical protein
MVRSTRAASHSPCVPASRSPPFRLVNFWRAVAVGATATRLRIAVAGRPMLGKPLKRDLGALGMTGSIAGRNRPGPQKFPRPIDPVCQHSRQVESERAAVGCGLSPRPLLHTAQSISRALRSRSKISHSRKVGISTCKPTKWRMAIIHYRRGANGMLTEMERVPTRGTSCSRLMAATIRCLPSRSATTAGSR